MGLLTSSSQEPSCSRSEGIMRNGTKYLDGIRMLSLPMPGICVCSAMPMADPENFSSVWFSCEPLSENTRRRSSSVSTTSFSVSLPGVPGSHAKFRAFTPLGRSSFLLCTRLLPCFIISYTPPREKIRDGSPFWPISVGM